MSATATRRPNTAERWAAAAERAAAAGLQAFTINGDPRHWFVTSGSVPSAGYAVEIVPGDAPRCGCQAGQHGDPVCQHRAAVLSRLGMLPRPARVAPVPADAEPVARQKRARRTVGELFGEAA